MSQIKVLVCDDSSIIRRLTKQALANDARINVVAEATNGLEALSKIESSKPDLVVLDVEMPVMDGVDAVRNIRRKYKNLPVIMFSSITKSSDSNATIDSLAAGASDFQAKPSSAGSLQAAIDQVGQELRKKIFALVPTPGSRTQPTTVVNKKILPGTHNIKIVGIGSSTGGPVALTTVMEKLDPSLNVPVLITQHMPATFIAPLAHRLSKASSFQVEPAENGQKLAPGKILIAPGDQHLCLKRNAGKVVVALDNGPMVNSCRPAVDRMFQSIAECYQGNCLAVVLTGMGRDGKDGALAIKSKGGVVFAQDSATSVVYGMPREVIESGAADCVFPISQMGNEISKLASAKNKQLVSATPFSN